MSLDTLATPELVFPVGHYLGALYPERNAPLAYHRLRVGQTVLRLFTDAEFGVWALAHGLAARLAEGPWTAEALVDVVREHDGTDVSPLLAELVSEHALVEVTPGTEAAVAFARGHRFRSLLAGLGTGPQRPGEFGIGLIGQPMAAVDERGYEFWQWAPLHASIWDACLALAEVDGRSGGGSSEPDQVLTDVLSRLHGLLAYGAGYLDEALS